MRRFYSITCVLLLLSGGCRSADSLRSAGGPDWPAPVAAPNENEPNESQSEGTANETAVRPMQSQLPIASPAPTQPTASHSTNTTHPLIRAVSHQEEGPLPVPMESVPRPLQKPAPVLGLVDFESIAMQNSPALSQATARLDAARGNWVQKGLYPNPDVGYLGQQLGSGNEATQQGIYLGQEFITGKKLRLNREVAAWEVERAERQVDAVRLRVLTDVRTGYYTTLIAQRRRELAEQLVDISDRGVRAAQSLFKGQEVGAADPLRAQIQSAEARIVLQNSINQHTEAWRRLSAVVGTPDMALQRVAGEIELSELELTWDESLMTILRESPELAAAMADLEAARWAIQRARAEVIPNIDVQAVVQDDRGTGSANGNLQVTIPLPIWNRNQGGIREARAQSVAAARAVNKLSLDLQARLAVAFQRYESARNQSHQYSRSGGILENAQQALDLVRTGYEAGELSVIDLLNAQRTYFEASLAYLNSLRELWVSSAEIRGLLLTDSLTK